MIKKPIKSKIGEKYSRLEIIDFIKKEKSIEYYNCKCICGNFKIIRYSDIINNKTKSCGCYRKEVATKNAKLKITHGHTKKFNISSEYYSWASMINRCTNIKCKEYSKYGAKGIIICDRWLESFENFIEDMGLKPDKSYSIDRIDNNGNYKLSNCRWATRIEQQNNKSNNKKVINFITNEEYPSMSAAARANNININTLRDQLIGKNKNKTNLKLKT